MNFSRKIMRFIKSPIWEKLIYIKQYHRIILSRLYYARIFKSFGAKSVMHSPMLISHPECVEIGNRVHIREGLRIEAITTWGDQRFAPQLKIEDGVSIEQNTQIACADQLTIKKNTVISFNVTITDIDHAYEAIDVNILQQSLKINKTTIGEYCFIGAGSKIFSGTTLGRQCIVAANSVVRGVFPDYTVIAGAPARAIKRYNTQTQQWEKISNV